MGTGAGNRWTRWLGFLSPPAPASIDAMLKHAREVPDSDVQIELEAEVKRLLAPGPDGSDCDLARIYRKHPGRHGVTARRKALLSLSLHRLGKRFSPSFIILQVAPGLTQAMFMLRVAPTRAELEDMPWATEEIPVYRLSSEEALPFVKPGPLPVQRPAITHKPMPGMKKPLPTSGRGR